jgi:hypothetical protein
VIFHGYVVQNHPKSPVLIGKSSISTINCHFLSILIAILKFQRVYQSRSAWLSGFDRSVGSIVRFGRCTRFTGLRIDQGQPWSTVYFFWPCKKCNFREIWAIYEEKFPMNSHSLYSIIPNMRGHMKSWKWLNMHEKTMLKKMTPFTSNKRHNMLWPCDCSFQSYHMPRAWWAPLPFAICAQVVTSSVQRGEIGLDCWRWFPNLCPSHRDFLSAGAYLSSYVPKAWKTRGLRATLFRFIMVLPPWSAWR